MIEDDRYNDLVRLLNALGLGDHARPMSPAQVFDLCLAEVAKLRASHMDPSHDRAMAEGGWQPIETAPMSGEVILLGFQGQFKWVTFVAMAFGSMTNAPGYAKPTHWHPAPAPPTPTTKEETAK